MTHVISVPMYVEMPDGRFIRSRAASNDRALQKQILETCRLTTAERNDLKRYWRLPKVN